jgi:hypothetical protein
LTTSGISITKNWGSGMIRLNATCLIIGDKKMSTAIAVALSRALAHVHELDEIREKVKQKAAPFGFDTHYAGQYVNPEV